MDATLPTTFGKYELLEKIGTGGMAEIYRARVEGPGGFEKILVLKKILPAFAENRAFVQMLIAEAKVSSVLHHANIVQIYELGEIEGQYYIAMEYVHGADLLRILTACSADEQEVPEELVLFLMSEVCKGVAHAHSATDVQGRPLNIIHRDISPSNVLLSFEGEVKVMDFGVARADLEAATSEDTTASGKNVLKGKLGYLSPELVRREEIDQRADVFALGVLLFEALTLKRLFVGKTDAETLKNIRDAKIDERLTMYPDLHENIVHILKRALDPDRETRFQTARAFQEALLDHLFEQRLRVSTTNLAVWMQRLFPTEVPAALRAATSAPATSRTETPDKPDTRPTRKAQDEGSPTEASSPRAPVPEVAAAGEATPPPTGGPSAEVEEMAAAAEAAALLRPEISDPGARGISSGILEGSTFYLKRPDGSPLGPMSLSALARLLEERAVSTREMVKIDEHPWIPIGEQPALMALCPVLLRDDEDPQYEGDIDRFRIPNLLYRMTVNRTDGTLRFTQGKTHKELVLQKGSVVQITSNIQSELLGEFMIAHRLIRPKDVQEAMELSREQDLRFGDALIRLGRVQPHDLFKILELQYREKIVELFRWTGGRYQFFKGVTAAKDTVWMSQDNIQLIMEAIRGEYDEATLRAALHPFFEQSIVHMDNPHITHNNLRLTGRELRFYTGLETGMVLRQVARRLGRDDKDYLTLNQVIFALYQTELLDFRSPSSSRSFDG